MVFSSKKTYRTISYEVYKIMLRKNSDFNDIFFEADFKKI